MENQQQQPVTVELHAIVTGYVQGVGFRFFVVQKAQALGLRGYARNLRDGSVEVLAQGSRSALDRLLTELRRGPSAAEVSDVAVRWSESSTPMSGFQVRW